MRSQVHRRAWPPRVAAIALAVLFGGAHGAASAIERGTAVAVFPVENLSGGGNVPAAEVRQALVAVCAAAGVRVLADDELEAFMTRHRVRYAAGIDAETAGQLRKETGVEGILVATIELSSRAVPPKIALIARFVTIADAPVVVWADDVALAGDDAPGLFDLGVVNDYSVLLSRALGRIGGSLRSYLTTGRTDRQVPRDGKFQPKSAYRGFEPVPGKTYAVAVVPFFNSSTRRNAGDILALMFIRHLASLAPFRVVDPGVARRQLLDARIVMDGGLSLSDADTIGALAEADLVLGGRVISYDDFEGPAGTARVEFSTVLIDRRSRRVLWSSDSYNSGSDDVGAFERGAAKTAHVMATQMVKLTAERMAATPRGSERREPQSADTPRGGGAPRN